MFMDNKEKDIRRTIYLSILAMVLIAADVALDYVEMQGYRVGDTNLNQVIKEDDGILGTVIIAASLILLSPLVGFLFMREWGLEVKIDSDKIDFYKNSKLAKTVSLHRYSIYQKRPVVGGYVIILRKGVNLFSIFGTRTLTVKEDDLERIESHVSKYMKLANDKDNRKLSKFDYYALSMMLAPTTLLITFIVYTLKVK